MERKFRKTRALSPRIEDGILPLSLFPAKFRNLRLVRDEMDEGTVGILLKAKSSESRVVRDPITEGSVLNPLFLRTILRTVPSVLQVTPVISLQLLRTHFVNFHRFLKVVIADNCLEAMGWP